MKANKHEINGYIYVYDDKRMILTNDKEYMDVQQLSPEEVEHCKGEVEVEEMLQKRWGVEWFDFPNQKEGREPDGIYRTIYKIIIPSNPIEVVARKYANITHDRPLDKEERYYKDYQKYDGFIDGYNHAKQIMYSEDDMKGFAKYLRSYEIVENDTWKFGVCEYDINELIEMFTRHFKK